jgi:hypothetical protein
MDLPTERIDRLKKNSQSLIAWLKETGIAYDDALPVLATTVGMIIRQQCAGLPAEVREAHLWQGVNIAHGFVTATALNMPQEAGELLKEPTKQ